MDYLPLFVELKQRPVLLVGGGHVAARKSRTVIKSGRSVTCYRATVM